MKFLVLTSLAFVVGQFSLVFRRMRGESGPADPERLDIAAIDEVPVGGAKVFEYPEGSSPRLLVRLDEERFVAYDQQCTHLQCPVLPLLDRGLLRCPCHDGYFDAETGRPTAGPPRRPLPRIHLVVETGRVFATGVELR